MQFSKHSFCCVLALLTVVSNTSAAEQSRPNVLFITVDDLNDWVGCLGGHPQAKTPNIDRLAARGVLFTNAHCTAPICNASRASVMTGLLPSTSGVHGNQQDWRRSKFVKGRATLPQYFKERGYWTGGCGKIYHANHGGECGALNGGHGGLRGFNHPPSWTERHPSKNQQLAKPAVMPGQNFNGLDIWHWDWGPIDVEVSATTDGQSTDWAVSKLKQKRERPFFLAVGIYRPHGPWYVPREFYKPFPLESVQLPKLFEDDLDDVPDIATGYARRPNNYHKLILENDLYESAVQSYLANIHFADAMIGKVLDALDRSPYAENTIVCLWSDHGWHLGEKKKWHKSTNWEEATRVPLIVLAPGVSQAGRRCSRPASLIDLYPTLLELCNLEPYEGLDGVSLVPQLRDPEAPRSEPALTIKGGRHVSVRDERWRYTRYGNGAEELYDHRRDPDEYHNLASDVSFAAVKRRLAREIPGEIRRVPQLNEPPHEPGFRPLFNGYDLTGWEGDPKLWKVEDGAIVGTTAADGQLEHNQFLIWRGGTVKNFELRFQARLEGDNNSGIQYRSQEIPGRKWDVKGYQQDVSANRDFNGMAYEKEGRAFIALRGQKVVITSEGRKMLVEKLEGAEKEFDAGKWKDYTISARGNHLIHKLNGTVVCEVYDHDAEHRALKGLLALQLHTGPAMRVMFRDVRLKEFGSGEIVPPRKTPIPDSAAEVNR